MNYLNKLNLMRNCKNKQGFTLLELLVVVTILGILAAVGMGQYRTSQMKARDGQRKSDLSNITRALEMYYNDHGEYPVSNEGEIQIGEGEEATTLPWGSSFETADTLYMKALPRDPEAAASGDSDWDYCYMSDGGDQFMIFARLENERDNDYQDSFNDTDCGSDYTYVITSSNAAKPTVNP
jgi:type II secretion system protein G